MIDDLSSVLRSIEAGKRLLGRMRAGGKLAGRVEAIGRGLTPEERRRALRWARIAMELRRRAELTSLRSWEG